MSKKHYLPNGYLPTADEVEKYIALPYGENPLVGNKKEEAMTKLFGRILPENKNIQDILIKCSALNGLASTNIFEVQYVAEHILALNIDERLDQGDFSLVDDIGKKIDVGGNRQRSHYSFASKYCSYHSPDVYSIYDRYVALVLTELQKRDNYSNFKRMEALKNYETYMMALDDFRKHYHLNYTKKDLDKYLWLLGKKYFSKYDQV